MGRQTTIYPTLIWDENVVILVDAGFPGLEQQIEEAINHTLKQANHLKN